jgi:lysophospholipase L1-like esterase
MTLALKLALAPLLMAQALATRRRALVLPEADGPRDGVHGTGKREPLRLLIAGDSSAAGVGVASQDIALAGHLVRGLHASLRRPVHWSLRARTGLTTRQLHAWLEATEDTVPAADIAVIVTGVNDVTAMLPPRRAIAHRAALADWLLSRGIAHVAFAALPPLGSFPLLPDPLRRVMGRDARAHDDALARWAATRHDVSHVPMAVELNAETMAADGFHPGEPVYRYCGETLAAHVARRIGRANHPEET